MRLPAQYEIQSDDRQAAASGCEYHSVRKQEMSVGVISDRQDAALRPLMSITDLLVLTSC